MDNPRHLWALVLAAGEGHRLRSAGVFGNHSHIPKQYQVLDGRESMLRWTIQRAVALVPRSRVVAIVARQHRRWWDVQLADLPADNVVVQPRNKGTAAGILLPLLTILQRDPEADILILPSDHYVEDEELLSRVLREAIGIAQRSTSQVVLLGVRPTDEKTDYGWIVPGSPCDGGPARTVATFEEKPAQQALERLLQIGAVVNSFILAARGRALLQLFVDTEPKLLEQLGECFGERSDQRPCLDRLYATLENTDFSSRVLQPRPERLLVHSVMAECGWTDLGTPARVRTYLESHATAVA